MDLPHQRLRRADTLPALAEAARACGLGALLDGPPGLFVEALPWSDAQATKLRALLEQRPPAQLGALLEDRELVTAWGRRGGVAGRAWLLTGLRAFLEAELAGRAPAVDRPPPPEASEAPAATLEARVTGPAARWLSRAPPGLRIGDLLAGPTTGPDAPPFALREAARRWAEEVSAELDAAADDPDPAQAPPPAVPELRAAWDHLLAARAALPGRPRRAVDPAKAQLRVCAEREAIAWSAPGPTCAGPGAPQIELPPRPGVPPLALSCGCAPALQAACPLRRQAIDAALAALAGGDPAFVAALAALLEAPAWSRQLGELDALLGGPGPLPGEALGWALRDDEWGRISLSPVLVPPGGAPRAAAGPVLRRHPELLAHPGDPEAAALLELGDGGRPDRGLVHRALAALAGHPRIYGPQRRARVEVQRSALGLLLRAEPDGGVLLQPALDGRPWPLDQVLGELREAAAGGRVVWRDPEWTRLTVAAAPPDVFAFFEALKQRGARFPAEGAGALLDRLPALQRLLPVDVDPALRGPALRVAPRPRLVLRMGPDARLSVRLELLLLPGASARPPGRGPEITYGQGPMGRAHLVRDFDDERLLAGELVDLLHLDPAGAAGDAVWALEGDRALAFLARAEDLAEAGALPAELAWAGPRPRLARAVEPSALRLEVQGGAGWFGVGGGLEVDGLELALGALLDQVRAGRRYVQLTTELFAELSDALRGRLGALAAGAPQGRLAPLLAHTVDALAQAGAQIQANAAWEAHRAALADAMAWEPPPPPGLRAELRAYQADGVRWMLRLDRAGAGGVLADDMGLGKTLQALALLCHRADRGPALVVAPTSVGPVWMAEAARFAPGLRLLPHRGPDRDKRAALAGPGDVLVTSYELLARDLAPESRGALADLPFATLILDEAQAVKNPGTQRWQAARAVQADRVFALSGTPVENRLEELWALLELTTPGLLGGLGAFRAAAQDPARREALPRLVRPFVLRRSKAEVAPELPPRIERVEKVEPGPAEAARYRRAAAAAAARVRQVAATGGDDQRRFEVLAALTRLRQLACHPALIDEGWTASSAKLDRAVELIDEATAAGSKVLVFSQFTRHLALVRAALEAQGHRCGWLDGSLSPAARQRAVEGFQAGQWPVFLLSLMAGGSGLTLTAADTVLLLDPWWNPAVEAQAGDRAHRIGQTRGVTIVKLVTAGTVEEQVLALQDAKRQLVTELFHDGGADLAALEALLLDSAQLFAAELSDAAAAPGASSGPG